MKRIKEEVHEKDLLPSIANIFVGAGWELVGDFHKVVFHSYQRQVSLGEGVGLDRSIFMNHDELGRGNKKVRARIAKHYVVKPPNHDVHYGIAVMSDSFVVDSDDIPSDKWIGNFATLDREETQSNRTVQYYRYEKEGTNEFGKLIFDMFESRLDKNKLYTYMTAKKPYMEDYTMLEVSGKTQTVIDLEVEYCEGAYRSEGTGSYQGVLLEASPNVYQSPFSVMRTRSIDVTFDTSLSEKFPIANTNWHDDSLFEINGVVEDNFAFLVLQADGAPAYDNNITPSVPLFFGQFVALDEKDKNNFALIAGSAFKTDNPRYDFDDPRPFDTTPLQPILKNYVTNPSNGIDNITVLRSKGGSYYQAHHLFVESDPNLMPPKREYDGRKYPSAWQQADAEPYDFQMNPSRYTNEAHGTKIYLAHMEEGVRGYLDGVIALNPISLLDGDILKNKVAWCEDGYDEYVFHVLSSVSPFTKVPSTPFRPLGLGIIRKRHEEE